MPPHLRHINQFSVAEGSAHDTFISHVFCKVSNNLGMNLTVSISFLYYYIVMMHLIP